MSDDDWLTDQPSRPLPGDESGQKVRPAPKLLQRPKVEDASENSEKVEKPVVKTLKQKEVEYAAARARIFGYDANGSGRGASGAASRGRGAGARGARGRGAAPRVSSTAGQGRKARVDADDPDYDRNPHRYAPRLNEGEEQSEPIHLRYAYAERSEGTARPMAPTYDTEFPSL